MQVPNLQMMEVLVEGQKLRVPVCSEKVHLLLQHQKHTTMIQIPMKTLRDQINVRVLVGKVQINMELVRVHDLHNYVLLYFDRLQGLC